MTADIKQLSIHTAKLRPIDIFPMAVFSWPRNDDARQEAHHFGVEPYDDVVENQLNTG
jgi:hypothetical protein